MVYTYIIQASEAASCQAPASTEVFQPLRTQRLPAVYSLREAVTRAGYRYYDWNASAGDAEGRYTAKQLFENAIRTSEGKTTVILLMHDGVGYKNTVRALPEIIRRFKNEGYVFKTL